MSSANARQLGAPQAPQLMPGSRARSFWMSAIMRMDSAMLRDSNVMGSYTGRSLNRLRSGMYSCYSFERKFFETGR